MSLRGLYWNAVPAFMKFAKTNIIVQPFFLQILFRLLSNYRNITFTPEHIRSMIKSFCLYGLCDGVFMVENTYLLVKVIKYQVDIKLKIFIRLNRITLSNKILRTSDYDLPHYLQLRFRTYHI